jgi:ABC-2 type transport system permease protein
MGNNVLNLIWKDFRALWSEKMSAFMFVGLFAISAIFASSPSFSSLVFVFVTASTYILNVFALEEKFRTERFFASLPVRRRDIVLARYGGVMAIAAAYFAMAYLVNVAFILAGKPGARPIPLGYFATVFAILAFFTSFSLPFYFKLGVAKAKTVTTVLVIVPMTVGVLLIVLRPSGGSLPMMKAISAVMSAPFPPDLSRALLTIGAAILLLGVSIPVAAVLYSRRDL